MWSTPGDHVVMEAMVVVVVVEEEVEEEEGGVSVQRCIARISRE